MKGDIKMAQVLEFKPRKITGCDCFKCRLIRGEIDQDIEINEDVLLSVLDWLGGDAGRIYPA